VSEKSRTRNRKRFETGQCKVLGPDVKNVRAVGLSPEMRVSKRPRSFLGPVRYGDSCGNLQPAKDDVNGTGATNIGPAATGFLHAAEQPEEQKYIPGADALILKMFFSGSNLSE
jgi:hypothetical protein